MCVVVVVGRDRGVVRLVRFVGSAPSGNDHLMYSLTDVPAGRVKDLFRLPYPTCVVVVGCVSEFVWVCA